MTAADLPTVAAWLHQPHVARWWLLGSSVEAELADITAGLDPRSGVQLRMVEHAGRAIGWCQWYRCGDDPAWATDMGAAPDDVGIDYAIGDPAAVGRGLGTALVAAIVAAVRTGHPRAALTADPHEGNGASRRVLERNGFTLMAVRPLPSERPDTPMAIYRLSS